MNFYLESDYSSLIHLGDTLMGIDDSAINASFNVLDLKMELWSSEHVYLFIISELFNEYDADPYMFEKFKIISGHIFKTLSLESCVSLSCETIGIKIHGLKEDVLRKQAFLGSIPYAGNYEDNYKTTLSFESPGAYYQPESYNKYMNFDLNPTYMHNCDESLDSNPCSDTESELKQRKSCRPRNFAEIYKSCEKKKEKLWEFIINLLHDSNTCPELIRWENFQEGTFKFVQNDKVAKIWGSRKKNNNMTYEKFSRAMRYYYKSKILLPVPGQRLVYKFGPQAKGWNRTDSE